MVYVEVVINFGLGTVFGFCLDRWRKITLSFSLIFFLIMGIIYFIFPQEFSDVKFTWFVLLYIFVFVLGGHLGKMINKTFND